MIGRLKKIRLWAVAAVTVGAGVAAAVATRTSLDDATLALEIVSITPDVGPDSGGQDVVISGLDFLKDRVNIVKVAAGGMHALAIDDQGNLYSWGNDSWGQIGDGMLEVGHEHEGDFSSAVLSPIKLTGLTVDSEFTNDLKDAYIVDIAASAYNSFAVDADGNLYSWGGDDYDMIGDGDLTRNHLGDDEYGYVMAPLKLTGLDVGAYFNDLKDAHIVGVAAGYANAFAYDNMGNLYAWGKDEIAIVGDGELTRNHRGDMPDGNVPAPIKLSGLDVGPEYVNQLVDAFVVKVVAGRNHVMAMDLAGNVYAWGDDDGQWVGDGDNTLNHDNGGDGSMVMAPTKLTGVVASGENNNDLIDAFIVDIAVGDYHSMAVDSAGNIYVWGAGDTGQLGIGDYRVNSDPYVYRAPLRLTGFDTGNTTVNELKGAKIVGVAAGPYYSMAIDENGNVYVWGNNEYGQLGLGEDMLMENVYAPRNLSVADTGDVVNNLTGQNVAQIVAGGEFALAINVHGDLFAWGQDGYGQTGDGLSEEGHQWDTSGAPVLAPIALSKINSETEFPNALYSPADPISVYLGTAICKSVVVISDTALACVTTAHPAGLVDVTVSNGLATTVLEDGYTYRIVGAPDTGVSG